MSEENIQQEKQEEIKETEKKADVLDMKSEENNKTEEAELGEAEKKSAKGVFASGEKKVKKIKKQVQRGKANVKCTYNNTIVSITDLSGNVLGWATSGLLGFKGAKKATPYAATQVVGNVAEKVKKYGVEELEVYVRGVGSGREASIRALANRGFELILIKDKTPVPHNGCRPKKRRRV
jgi:small subunit ribosomal protein S11